jgi:histidine ammonia-lyase
MKEVLPRTGLPLELDGRSLTIEEVVAFARRDVECALSAESAEKIEAARKLKRGLIERETPLYPASSSVTRRDRRGRGS